MLKTFIIGTSALVSFLPYLYIGRANIKYGPVIPRYEHMILFLPLYFGIMNILFMYITPLVTGLPKFSIINSLLTGAFVGLLLSIIGRFGFDMPKKLFKEIKNENMIHLYAMILYSIEFTLITRNLNILFD